MKKLAFLLSGLLLFSCGSDDEKIDPVEQQAEFNKKAVVGKWVSFAYDVAYKGRFEVTSHDTRLARPRNAQTSLVFRSLIRTFAHCK